MNIKKMIILCAIIPCLVYAEKSEQELHAERMKMLADLGLPLPDSGIKIVPRSMLDLSKEELERGAKEESQMAEVGYIQEYTNRPQELLHFKSYADLEFKNNEGNLRDSSTHIRHEIKDLKLGFEFKKIPDSLMKKYIGVIPQGGFHKEGWSGAVQFFDVNTIGTCAYAVMNVKVSHTAARLAMESITYEINNKATLKSIRGSKDSGFIYKIKWFDDKNFHELECANMNYSANTTNAVIELASEIDASQQ